MPVEDTIKIMQWNAQCITDTSKLIELRSFLNYRKIDILLLNETYLKEKHRFYIPGYSIYRKDRLGHGGGVAICIKNIIKHNVISFIIMYFFSYHGFQANSIKFAKSTIITALTKLFIVNGVYLYILF